jgi:hypothetical protein
MGSKSAIPGYHFHNRKNLPLSFDPLKRMISTAILVCLAIGFAVRAVKVFDDGMGPDIV